MPEVYIHLAAQDVDNPILNLYKEEPVKEETSQLDEIKKFYLFWKQMKALS